jgi:hypothetical protein
LDFALVPDINIRKGGAMHIATVHLEQMSVLWPGLMLMGFFLSTVLQPACEDAVSSGSEIDRDGITRIVYQYGDSSVPPQYHRSSRIDVSPMGARITVDSYGSVLADKSYRIMRSDFDGLLDSLSSNAIRNVPSRDNEGCTGGTSETISTFNQQTLTFSGQVYHCGGEDSGNLGGNIREFADDLRALFPELADLLR